MQAAPPEQTEEQLNNTISVFKRQPDPAGVRVQYPNSNTAVTVSHPWCCIRNFLSLSVLAVNKEGKPDDRVEES